MVADEMSRNQVMDIIATSRIWEDKCDENRTIYYDQMK